MIYLILLYIIAFSEDFERQSNEMYKYKIFKEEYELLI